MKFTLTVVALFSVLGRADAALRNSNALVPNEGEIETTAECEDPKCEGMLACDGVDESKVGCGSCLGDMACEGYNGDSIGENSCKDEFSCNHASAIIGKNSCNALHACAFVTGYIPDNQCNSEDECSYQHFPPALSLYKDDLTGVCLDYIGKAYPDVRIEFTYLSENSPEACAQFCRQPSLNNGFQVGMQMNKKRCSCLYDGGVELPSPFNTGQRISEGPVAHSTGDLNPDMKCYPLSEDEVKLALVAACDPKCTGDFACEGIDQSKVGCGSCLGPYACVGFTGDSIGENSCTKFGSCMDASATIGENSCNADYACNEATGYIPDNQCNSYSACHDTDFPSSDENA